MTYSIYTESLFGQPQTIYSGLASGTDTQSIVQAKIAAAGQNQAVLNADATNNLAIAALYGSIASQLGTLENVTDGLQDAGTFAPSSGTSSNTAALPVTVSTTAQTGTYSVNVTQLAQAQSNTSDNFSSASSTVLAGAPNIFTAAPTSGSLQLQVGSGAAVSFAVSKTTTLTQLAAAINSSSLAPQVTATVVNDANGYRLNLVGDNTGSANAITITETNTTLNLNNHKLQSAQNAQGTVNGAAFSDATNTDSSAILGVTMSFATLTGSPVTVTVFKDANNLANQVQTFVMNYNASLQQLNTAMAYGPNTNLNNLISDSGVQSLAGELSKAITSSPASASGAYRTLAQAGISLNTDGTLAVDSTALSAAIAKDASSVANLISNSKTGQGIAQKVDAVATAFGGPTGTLALMSQAQAGIASDNTQTAADMQYSIDALQQTMQTDFVAYEKQMSMLSTQNLLVQALASSITGVTSPTPSNATAAESASSTATPPTPTPDAQLVASSYYGSNSVSTTSGPTGLNGYVPAVSDV